MFNTHRLPRIIPTWRDRGAAENTRIPRRVGHIYRTRTSHETDTETIPPSTADSRRCLAPHLAQWGRWPCRDRGDRADLPITR